MVFEKKIEAATPRKITLNFKPDYRADLIFKAIMKFYKTADITGLQAQRIVEVLQIIKVMQFSARVAFVNKFLISSKITMSMPAS